MEVGPIRVDGFFEHPDSALVMTLLPVHTRRDAEWYGSELPQAGVCCERNLEKDPGSKQEYPDPRGAAIKS